ncbi:ATP-binding protein [Geothrix sp. 21YS21S-2]|uniref:ATP-binding protein n=1 Tax=Geothrix sp. 21YS21S-2 TaxID=3068893 RepID=UPI0027B939B5|nr:ATP-binding protein [Geothrix sp. 21YS21S-2]
MTLFEAPFGTSNSGASFQVLYSNIFFLVRVILLLGPPGVGKTHLAIGLGRKAIQQGYSCRFITALDVVHQLTVGYIASSQM